MAPSEYERTLRNPLIWTKEEGGPPPAIWTVIEDAYIRPLLVISRSFGVQLVPSDQSGYRSPRYEISRGRSGRSVHTFPPGSLGAADLRYKDSTPIVWAVESLIDAGPWQRIAVYVNHQFVHVDYGHPSQPTPRSRTLYTCSGPLHPWKFAGTIPGPVINGSGSIASAGDQIG
jgi:hypothetical protein